MYDQILVLLMNNKERRHDCGYLSSAPICAVRREFQVPVVEFSMISRWMLSKFFPNREPTLVELSIPLWRARKKR